MHSWCCKSRGRSARPRAASCAGAGTRPRWTKPRRRDQGRRRGLADAHRGARARGYRVDEIVDELQVQRNPRVAPRKMSKPNPPAETTAPRSGRMRPRRRSENRNCGVRRASPTKRPRCRAALRRWPPARQPSRPSRGARLGVFSNSGHRRSIPKPCAQGGTPSDASLERSFSSGAAGQRQHCSRPGKGYTKRPEFEMRSRQPKSRGCGELRGGNCPPSCNCAALLVAQSKATATTEQNNFLMARFACLTLGIAGFAGDDTAVAWQAPPVRNSLTREVAKAEDLVAPLFQALASPKVGQLDDEAAADHDAAHRLNKPYGRFCRPARGDQIVNQ